MRHLQTFPPARQCPRHQKLFQKNGISNAQETQVNATEALVLPMSSTFLKTQLNFNLFICTKEKQEISFFFGRPRVFLVRRGNKTDYKLLLITAGKRMDIYYKVCCYDFSVVAVAFVFFLVTSWLLCRFYGQLYSRQVQDSLL